MRILVLSHRTLFPQNGGYPIVVYNTIKGLVKHGHEVTLVSLDERAPNHRVSTQDKILEQITYKVYQIDADVSVLDSFISIFTRQTHIVDKYYHESVEKMLVQLLREREYDIIQFEGLFVVPYLQVIRNNTKAKTVYRAHNIEHQVWYRLARQKADPFKKLYLRSLAQRVKNYELEWLNRFDSIITFTTQDEALLRSYQINVPIQVLPISVDMERYRPDYNKTEFPSLFFLGSLAWLPNRESIEWFISNFHSELTTGNLRVPFYLAGNDIPEQFDDYEVPGKIYIQGEVDDALEFVNNKSIMIVPLLSGGGMRVKIVEGMAMQKCIISTSLGADGINYEHESNIVIANSREEFYNAIQKCITDENYCKNIGQNARSLVEEQHNIDVVAHKLVSYYRQLLSA